VTPWRLVNVGRNALRQNAGERSASWWSILCPYLLLRLSWGIVVWSSPMTLTLDEDEILSAAIAGVPRVAELIATVPAEDRSRALEAAEKSYLETAHTLGYQDADAQKWASAVMSRLRIEEDSYKLRMLTSPPTSPS
jgi:hypothetical protein